MTAISTLKEEYKPDFNLKQALFLCLKVLSKSMDATKPDPTKFEIGMMHLDKNGKVVYRLIEGEELQEYLNESKIFEEKK